MMKKILLSVIMAAVGVSATAKPISKSSAAAKAAKYMYGMSSQSKGKMPHGTGMIQSVLTADAADEAYYAFNAADGNGFVIISGDDELPELVGYSKSGSLSADDMADGLKYYLKRYTEYVRQVREGLITAHNEKTDNSYTPVVDTLITTLWDQAYPYNKYAPEERSYFKENFKSHFPIGCVALAYAQVMNYWQWPKAIIPGDYKFSAIYSTLDKDGNVIQPNIPTGIYPNADGNIPYDWERIGDKKLSYNNAEGVDDYEAKADAAGVLLRDVAYALSMSWNKGGGGTLAQIGVLTKYFGYSMEVSTLQANSFEGGSKGQKWLDLIKTDIDKHQPIIYSGSGPAGGHCFVFDGYDTGNRVHVNWGWGGKDNGWFDVYCLITSTYDNHGQDSYDFSNNNYMIYNLHPNYDGKEEHMKPTRHRLAHNGTDIIFMTGEESGGSVAMDKTPFIAPYESVLYLCHRTYIDSWMSGIGYDIRLTRVSQETGEADTCTVLDAMNSQNGIFIQNLSALHGVMIVADCVRGLPDGIYAYTVEYNIFNDVQEQTGWLTPCLFQATPSNTFYLEKKNKQCVFYVSPDIYNVIDYRYIDNDDAWGWFNIHSNQGIDSIKVGDSVTFSCNIDLPEIKMSAMKKTDDSPCITVLYQDGNTVASSPLMLEMSDNPESPETITCYTTGNVAAKFASPGTYTLVIDVPALGYSLKKDIIIGGTETGITSVTSANTSHSSAAYSLSGQRVTDSYRGIVVSNGRKMVVR